MPSSDGCCGTDFAESRALVIQGWGLMRNAGYWNRIFQSTLSSSSILNSRLGSGPRLSFYCAVKLMPGTRSRKTSQGAAARVRSRRSWVRPSTSMAIRPRDARDVGVRGLRFHQSGPRCAVTYPFEISCVGGSHVDSFPGCDRARLNQSVFHVDGHRSGVNP